MTTKKHKRSRWTKKRAKRKRLCARQREARDMVLPIAAESTDGLARGKFTGALGGILCSKDGLLGIEAVHCGDQSCSKNDAYETFRAWSGMTHTHLAEIEVLSWAPNKPASPLEKLAKCADEI